MARTEPVMAREASEPRLTLEFHGFLGDRLAALGERRGTRVVVSTGVSPGESVARRLARLVREDARYALVFDPEAGRLPEHVEVVLNGRVLDLAGGLAAPLRPDDVLVFVPAYAGGAPSVSPLPTS